MGYVIAIADEDGIETWQVDGDVQAVEKIEAELKSRIIRPLITDIKADIERTLGLAFASGKARFTIDGVHVGVHLV